jgi:hypothetical protein
MLLYGGITFDGSTVVAVQQNGNAKHAESPFHDDDGPEIEFESSYQGIHGVATRRTDGGQAPVSS